MMQNEKIATRTAYGNTLAKIGSDERIVVMDADLSKSTMTAEFGKKYPERFVQMGIAEQDMMSTAAGLAASGKIVFASTFAMFACGRAWEQIRNSVCYPSMNVKVCATHSGVTVGEDGGSHQAVEDIAIMRVIPNMTVIVPSDATYTKWAVKKACEIDGPVYIRLGRLAVPVIYGPDEEFEIGKGKVLKEGCDVTLMACGLMVSEALEARDILESEGIMAEVVDMMAIKPLDEELVLNSAKKTGCIVTCEEHSTIGGLGGAVCEYLSAALPTPVIRVGLRDCFGKSGKPDELLSKFKLKAIDIVEAAKSAIAMK